MRMYYLCAGIGSSRQMDGNAAHDAETGTSDSLFFAETLCVDSQVNFGFFSFSPPSH